MWKLETPPVVVTESWWRDDGIKTGAGPSRMRVSWRPLNAQVTSWQVQGGCAPPASGKYGVLSCAYLYGEDHDLAAVTLSFGT